MERIPVEDSTQVASYGYQEPILEIEFKGRNGNSVYQYRNVTAEMWASLLRAPSKGRWVGEHLKKNPQAYPYTKIQ